MTDYTFKAISLINKKKLIDRSLLISCQHPLYFLIEIKHSLFPTNALAYRIMQTVKEKYSEGFEEALKEVNDILAKLTSEGQTEWIGNLSAIIVLLDKDKINLSSLGNASCFLFRNENIIEITSDQPKEAHPLKAFSHILNGDLKEKDKIAIGNLDFFDNLPLNNLKDILLKKPIKEATIDISHVLQEQRAKKASALILETQKKKPNNSLSSAEMIYLDQRQTIKTLGKIFRLFSSWLFSNLGRFRLPKIIKAPKKKNSNIKNSNVKKWILVGSLLLLFLISIFEISNLIKNRPQTKEAQNQRQIIMAAEDKEREADQALKSANKEEAFKLYEQALQVISSVKTKEATSISSKISAKIDKMNNIVRVSPTEGFDFSIFKNSSISRIFVIDKTIYSVDTKNNQIYKEKSNPSSLPQSSGQFVSGVYQEDAKILDLYQDLGGIYEYKVDENKLEKAQTVFDDKWEKAKILGTYFSNLYLLDPQAGQIYRHEKTAAGYSKGIAYVNKDKVNLKKAISMTLDGYIYVLNNDGTVIKLMGGRPVTDFALKGIPGNATIKNPIKIITSPEMKSLYILDGERILEFDKNGNYLRMFMINSITGFKDFVIDFANKKVYLLSGTKVYEFGLKIQ